MALFPRLSLFMYCTVLLLLLNNELYLILYDTCLILISSQSSFVLYVLLLMLVNKTTKHNDFSFCHTYGCVCCSIPSFGG